MRNGPTAEPARVQTVLGPVAPAELGYTQMHEHLLSDLSRFALPVVEPDEGGPWYAREIDQETIRPQDYQWIRRYQRHHRGNLVLDDVDVAVDELADYARLGGRTIVEVTTDGIGRDPRGLAEIARRTGLHIVMGSGYYAHGGHPEHVRRSTVEELAERIVHEVRDGVGSTGIRPGIIGEIGQSWPTHPDEERVLRAAGMAQCETGLAIQVHPGRDVRSPYAALELIVEGGGSAERTIIAHVERTFFSLDEMSALADTGAYLELDLFGYEAGYYPFADIDLPNDTQRIDYLLGLRDRGYLDRLLISSDIVQKVRLKRYGGEGYEHILENVVPLMRRKGLSEDDIAAITTRNPARILACKARVGTAEPL
jgi:phosphotriesterase-related protein